MLKWIVIYLVVGVIAEIIAGWLGAYEEDKAGYGDLTSRESRAMIGYYLTKNNNLYHRFLCSLPNLIAIVIGNLVSFIFWPIHAPWIYSVNKKAVNLFKEYDEGKRDEL